MKYTAFVAGLAIYIAGLSVPLSGVLAQTPPQAAPAVRTMKELKSDFDRNTDGEARTKVLEEIQALAETKDADALLFLGEAYARGEGVAADGEKAAGYFARAGEAGNGYAFARAGDLYREGTLVSADPARAFGYYEQGAAKGNGTAKLRLGEAYLKGEGVAADPAKGIDLVRQQAAQGDKAAMRSLGDYLSRGRFIDPAPGEALAAYESAAQAGDAGAYVRLGEIFRDGLLVPRDVSRSTAYYDKAVSAGLTSARVLLGQNHVDRRYGRASDPPLGAKLIRSAYDEGEQTAAPVLANLYLWGRGGVSQSPTRAIALLTEASQRGNPAAIRMLISLYREGRDRLVKRNIPRASQIFEQNYRYLSGEDALRERFLLSSAAAASLSQYSDVESMLDQMPSDTQASAIIALRNANQNAFVYVIQDRLRLKGLYSGSTNGLLTSGTIRAINTLCRQSVGPKPCEKGPLHGDTARAIAPHLM